ncbi:MAG: sugar-binding protein [Opitutales bacterium]
MNFRVFLASSLATTAVCLLPAVTLRPYFIGNSVTDQSNYGDLQQMAESRGHTHLWDRTSVPGSSLRLHVADPSRDYATDFNQTWDVLTLQPFASAEQELPAAETLVDLFRQNSPDGIVYIYALALNSQTNSWQAGDWLDRSGFPSADYFANFVDDLQASRPGNEPIRMIPTGHVFWELHQRMQAGLIPGYTDINQVYKDGWHYGPVGDYIVMMSFFATLYGENPVGMTRFPPYDFDPTLAFHIEDAAWQVVTRTPRSGRAPDFVVATPSLPRGLTNTAFSASLEQTGGSGNVTWSHSGALPSGVTLDAAGNLSGTPSENGVFPITVTATDGDGATADRDLFLFIDSDTVPIIQTSKLTATPVGGYIRESVEAVSGVGAISWSITEGALPLGVSFSANGEMEGSPIGSPGDYYFTATAADSNPVTPSTVERELILNVVAPESGTFETARIETEPTIDGVLDEAFWELPATANWVIEGSPDNTAAFGVRWSQTALYVAVEVTDASLVSDSVDVLDDDHIQLYLDGLHDRETEFNADDRQIFLGADGRFVETSNRGVGMTHAVSTFADGWRAEICIPWSNFDVDPSGERFSLGFDLAVVDDDDGGARDGTQVWLSASDRERKPSQFGNLVCLTAGPTSTILIDSGMELTPNPSTTTLGFGETISTAREGKGWQGNSLRPFNDSPVDGGFPDRCALAFANSSGAMLQIVEDGGATTGDGILSVDVFNPSSDLTYHVWGYNGDASTVNGKIGAAATDYPPTGGSPDGIIGNGNFGGISAAPDTWEHINVPVDFGAGYDYIVVAIGAPGNLTDVLVDNIRLGPALTQRLHYKLPADQATGQPRRELLLNHEFEQGFAGTLGFGVEIQTAQADQGWFRNPSGRTVTSFSNDGFTGRALEISGGSQSALLQVVEDNRETTGAGTFSFYVYNPREDQRHRFAVLGYRGSASEVDNKLGPATSSSTFDQVSRAADGIIALADIRLDNPEPDTWYCLQFAADFAEGYDYILAGIGADSDTGGTRIDRASLTVDVQSTATPEVSVTAPDPDASESGPESGRVRVAVTEPQNFAMPVRLGYSGTASNDGSDFTALPATVVIPARDTELELAVQPVLDREPEGHEQLNVSLTPSTQYVAAPGVGSAQVTINDHPVDVWLLNTFGGVPADDSDGDGVHWIVERFTGTDAQDATDAQSVSIWPVEVGGELRGDVQVQVDPAVSGIRAQLRIGSDLVTWESLDLDSDLVTLLDEMTNPDGTVTRTYRMPDRDGESLFISMTLTRE